MLLRVFTFLLQEERHPQGLYSKLQSDIQMYSGENEAKQLL